MCNIRTSMLVFCNYIRLSLLENTYTIPTTNFVLPGDLSKIYFNLIIVKLVFFLQCTTKSSFKYSLTPDAKKGMLLC